jgi:hypothetical protein
MPADMKRPAPSTKPLAVKLGIKPGFKVLLANEPVGFVAALGSLPEGAALVAAPGPADLIVLFVTSLDLLRADLPGLKAMLKPGGLFWIAWRKGGVGEVTRDNMWPIAGSFGLQPVANVAVDEVWSALRFKVVG